MSYELVKTQPDERDLLLSLLERVRNDYRVQLEALAKAD